MCVCVCVCVVPYCSEKELSPLKVYAAGLDGLHFYDYERLRLEPGGRATKKVIPSLIGAIPLCFAII
jgi:hypothetical protein